MTKVVHHKPFSEAIRTASRPAYRTDRSQLLKKKKARRVEKKSLLEVSLESFTSTVLSEHLFIFLTIRKDTVPYQGLMTHEPTEPDPTELYSFNQAVGTGTFIKAPWLKSESLGLLVYFAFSTDRDCNLQSAFINLFIHFFFKQWLVPSLCEVSCEVLWSLDLNLLIHKLIRLLVNYYTLVR